MRDLPFRIVTIALSWIVLSFGAGAARAQPADLEKPAPIPEATLGPTLKTIPVLRSAPLRNLIVVDPTLLPRDEIARRNSMIIGVEPEQLPEDSQKFWVLDFAFKPIRILTVETPKGRRMIYYLYYRVINHTGRARMFVPQFTLVTDDGKFFDDQVLPRAVEDVERRERSKALRVIEAREDPTTPLLGAVEIIGVLPPSAPKQGVDDAVYGVAIWEVNDDIARADSFQIYARGLSNGSFPDKLDDNTPIVRYKTLRIDFASPGDERDRNESEIRLLDPPYHWEYPDPLNARQKPKSAADVKKRT